MTDTDDRILDAAEELISERGYAGMTTRALAERAEVNEVTVFRRFGSKLGVLQAMFLRMGADAMARAADGGLPSAGPREVLGEMARREVETAIRHGGVALRVAFEARSVPEVAELLGEAPLENLQALADMLAGWQAEGKLRGDLDPRLMAEAFASLTSSYVMYRQVMGMQPTEDLSAGEAVEQLVEIFLTGVEPR